MNRNKALLLICALGLGLSAESMAVTITVDGNLSDWGLNWSDSDNSNDWTPTPNMGISYTVEDYTGGNNRNGQVNPGYGGQAYDAEALYVTWDANNLYIALVTGHSPTTPDSNGDFGPGDFALAFWDGTGTRSICMELKQLVTLEIKVTFTMSRNGINPRTGEECILLLSRTPRKLAQQIWRFQRIR